MDGIVRLPAPVHGTDDGAPVAAQQDKREQGAEHYDGRQHTGQRRGEIHPSPPRLSASTEAGGSRSRRGLYDSALAWFSVSFAEPSPRSRGAGLPGGGAMLSQRL